MSRSPNHRNVLSGVFGALTGIGLGLLGLSILGPMPVMAGDMLVCNNSTRTLPSDFLFAIDASGSMCPYINQIEASLQRFVDELMIQKADATFSIVVFGDMPTIILPFTSNATLTQQTLANVGCSRGGQEAGFEVIRMSLARNNGSDFGKSCVSPFTSSTCNLRWRAGAKRHIILATDEDSDMPFVSSYRLANQPRGLCAVTYDTSGTTCSGNFLFEPPFQPRVFWSSGRQFYRNSSAPLTLDPIYSAEIALTAQLVVENAVSVSLLIKSDFNANRNGPISNWDSTSRYFNTFAVNKADVNNIHTATLQYGDPRFAAEDAITFTNFSAQRTLANLNANGLSGSFQARVLAAGGFARVFRIQDIIDTTLGPNVIENIYTAIAVFVSNCTLIYVPDPSPSPTSTALTISTTSVLPTSVLSTATSGSTSSAISISTSPLASFTISTLTSTASTLSSTIGGWNSGLVTSSFISTETTVGPTVEDTLSSKIVSIPTATSIYSVTELASLQEDSSPTMTKSSVTSAIETSFVWSTVAEAEPTATMATSATAGYMTTTSWKLESSESTEFGTATTTMGWGMPEVDATTTTLSAYASTPAEISGSLESESLAYFTNSHITTTATQYESGVATETTLAEASTVSTVPPTLLWTNDGWVWSSASRAATSTALYAAETAYSTSTYNTPPESAEPMIASTTLALTATVTISSETSTPVAPTTESSSMRDSNVNIATTEYLAEFSTTTSYDEPSDVLGSDVVTTIMESTAAAAFAATTSVWTDHASTASSSEASNSQSYEAPDFTTAYITATPTQEYSGFAEVTTSATQTSITDSSLSPMETFTSAVIPPTFIWTDEGWLWSSASGTSTSTALYPTETSYSTFSYQSKFEEPVTVSTTAVHIATATFALESSTPTADFVASGSGTETISSTPHTPTLTSFDMYDSVTTSAALLVSTTPTSTVEIEATTTEVEAQSTVTVAPVSSIEIESGWTWSSIVEGITTTLVHVIFPTATDDSTSIVAEATLIPSSNAWSDTESLWSMTTGTTARPATQTLPASATAPESYFTSTMTAIPPSYIWTGTEWAWTNTVESASSAEIASLVPTRTTDEVTAPIATSTYEGAFSSLDDTTTTVTAIPPTYVWTEEGWIWSSMSFAPSSTVSGAVGSVTTSTLHAGSPVVDVASTISVAPASSESIIDGTSTITHISTGATFTADVTTSTNDIPTAALVNDISSSSEISAPTLATSTITVVKPTSTSFDATFTGDITTTVVDIPSSTVVNDISRSSEILAPTLATSTITVVKPISTSFGATFTGDITTTDTPTSTLVNYISSSSEMSAPTQTTAAIASLVKTTYTDVAAEETASTQIPAVFSNTMDRVDATTSTQIAITSFAVVPTQAPTSTEEEQIFHAGTTSANFVEENLAPETTSSFIDEQLPTTSTLWVPTQSVEPVSTKVEFIPVTTALLSSDANIVGSTTTQVFMSDSTAKFVEVTSTASTHDSIVEASSTKEEFMSTPAAATSNIVVEVTTSAIVSSATEKFTSTAYTQDRIVEASSTKEALIPSSTAAASSSSGVDIDITTTSAIASSTAISPSVSTATEKASTAQVTYAPTSDAIVVESTLGTTATVSVPTTSESILSTKEDLKPSTSSQSDVIQVTSPIASISPTVTVDTTVALETTVVSSTILAEATNGFVISTSAIPPPPEPSTFIPWSSSWTSPKAILTTTDIPSISPIMATTSTVEPIINTEDPVREGTLEPVSPTPTTVPIPTPTTTTSYTTTVPPTESPKPETPPTPPLTPPATIGLSVAGGVLAVGGAAAIAFMYKSGSIGTSMLRVTAVSDPMLQMARANPLYESPGGVHENPLYQPNDAGGGNEGWGRRGFADDVV